MYFGKQYKNLLDMDLVLFGRLGISQIVVNISDTENIKLFSENDINETLKQRWSIHQTEQHDKVFEGCITGLEGNFSTPPLMLLGEV